MVDYKHEADALIARFMSIKDSIEQNPLDFLKLQEDADDTMLDMEMLLYSYDPRIPLLRKAVDCDVKLYKASWAPTEELFKKPLAILQKFIRLLEVRAEMT